MSLQRIRHYAFALLLCPMLAGAVPVGASAQAHPLTTATPKHAAASGVTGRIGGSAGPQREIFGFALASSLSDPTVGYPSWDFPLVTTVAYFGLHVNDNGTIASDQGWTVWNSSQLTNLLTTAHSTGTKVVLTVVMQDFSAGTPHMCAALSHYSTTVSAIAAQVKAKGVDGVNLDYEGLNGSCGTGDSSWARHMMSNLAASMRSALPTGSYLSVDTYASAAVAGAGFFDVPTLNRFADSFFVMAYDLEYSNWSRTPTSCSSFCLGPTAPLAGYYYNDRNTVSQYVAKVPASKVILGVPYYGRKACVASAAPNQLPTSSVVADTYLDAAGESRSSEVQAGSYVSHRDANDPSGQERWDTWFNTTKGCTRELYWDDTVSLGAKYDLVNAYNLRGVGMWNLNYGGGAQELWHLLAAKFATTTPWSSLGGVATSGVAASSWGASRTDAFIRGADHALWHRMWNGSAWGAWESLGGALASDPAAVSWGANRIDVFASGNDRALWTRTWDGTRWSAWQSLGGSLAGGPAVASWASGHLDVFARGSDSRLWQRTFDSAVGWGKWGLVGGILTSDPGAWSSQTNRTNVFARGADHALWQNSWNGTAWTGWQSLKGNLASGPGVASCYAGHVDVFAAGSDSALYQIGFNGTSWGAWQRLGGRWIGDPGAVCPNGTTAISLFERGIDNALWSTSVTPT